MRCPARAQPLKKPVKKPVKKVAKKVVKKAAPKKAPVRKVAAKKGGAAQDTTVTKVVSSVVKTFDGFGLTPTVISGILVWVLFVLKFAIFYEK